MFGFSLLIGLLISIIGISPILISKVDDRKAIATIYGIISFLITSAMIYHGLFSVAYPIAGFYFIITFIWFLIATIRASVGKISSGNKIKIKSANPILLAILAGLLLIGSFVYGWGGILFWGTQDHKYATLVGTIDNKTMHHWTQDQQTIDPTHLRLVTYDLANSLASTSLSDTGGHTLGSQYVLDEAHTTLQKINNEYWYLIPIDFAGFWRWMNTDYISDYVKVSATNTTAKPILVHSNQKMKYTFAACFGDNIERMLYKKYYNYVLEDYTFEEDENGKVWWTVSATQPSIGWEGPVVKGIVLFDPETGNDTFVPKKEIDNNNPKYAWIDRVIPKHIIEYNISKWGEFKGGYSNSAWWGKKNNLLQPETAVLNYSSDGRCVYVTPVTSVQSDQTMVGLIYTDARTGASTFYTTDGGQTEESVIGTIEGAIKLNPTWYVSEQIVYENIYGELCALIPVLSKDNRGMDNFQCLGIVSTKTKQYAIGKTPMEALQAFVKNIINSNTQLSTESTINTNSVRGVVWRIAIGDNNTRYFQFKNLHKAFVMTTSNMVETILTKEGDSVEIQYINSDEAALPTVFFKNISNPIEISKNQKIVNDKNSATITEQKKKANTKDMNAIFDTLSVDQKLRLFEQMKKQKK